MQVAKFTSICYAWMLRKAHANERGMAQGCYSVNVLNGIAAE